MEVPSYSSRSALYRLWGVNQKWSLWCKVGKIFLSPSWVMFMSFWDLKEPQCHGLRLFGNLGVYQGIISSFGLLFLGGWEKETSCTLLILMLVVSSIQIMRKAIVTSSLLVVGHPFCGQRWNPGFSSAVIWSSLVVLFEALISGGKTLFPGWKGSPSALLSTWYGKKGIAEFLKTPAHWLNLLFRDFRFYSTWYCTFISAIILKFLWAGRIGGCFGCSLLWDVVFSSICSPYSLCFWADRIGCCCFSSSFVVLHDVHVCHSL